MGEKWRTGAKPLVWELTVDGMDQKQTANWFFYQLNLVIVSRGWFILRSAD